MKKKIRVFDKYKTINTELAPKTLADLNAYIQHSECFNVRFLKGAGGWYMQKQGGNLQFVCRALYQLSFDEWLEAATRKGWFADLRY